MKKKPCITKLGTTVCDLVEATPIVWRDRLYRYEYVRTQYYQHNSTGDSYFRFVDIETGENSPAFAQGYVLGCAMVDDGRIKADRIYSWGSNTWGGDEIRGFWSDDMEHWDEATALHLPGWALYNMSVCPYPDGYIMALEAGGPEEYVGSPFTIFFARSTDLRDWELLPPETYVHTAERYSACPTIRFVDGQFYMVYLEAIHGGAVTNYELYIARSADLANWELSPLNPVMVADDDDRILNGEFTDEERQRIATAVNINNSDFDLCEFRGQTHMTYSWGNQHGVEHLAAAMYDGPVDEFLSDWFDRP